MAILSVPIKVRMGLEANRQGITPSEGELIATTDTNKLFLGDGSTAGGVAVGADVVLPITTVGTSGSGADYETTGTDDQNTWQNAVDSLVPAGGGTVHVLQGTYTFSGPVNLKDGIYISGDSEAGVVIEVAPYTGYGAPNLFANQWATGKRDFGINNLTMNIGSNNYRGFSFNGDEPSQTDAFDWETYYIDNVKVSNVTINDAGTATANMSGTPPDNNGEASGFNFSKAKYSKIENVKVNNAMRDGAHYEYLWNNHITGVRVYDQRRLVGFNIHRGWHNLVEDCHTYNSQSDGFQFKGIDQATDYHPTTTLNGAIGASDQTITVTDGTGMMKRFGWAKIGNEHVYYHERDGNTLRGCERGMWNTTRSAHNDGAAVDGTPVLDGNTFKNCTSRNDGRNKAPNSGVEQTGSGFFFNNWYLFGTVFENCHAYNSGESGFKTSDAVRFARLINCSVFGANNNAVNMNGGDHIIEGGTFYGKDDGIYMPFANNSKVTNCNVGAYQGYHIKPGPYSQYSNISFFGTVPCFDLSQNNPVNTTYTNLINRGSGALFTDHGNTKLHISPQGSLILPATSTAHSGARLDNGSINMYINEGTNKAAVKIKDSGGTVTEYDLGSSSLGGTATSNIDMNGNELGSSTSALFLDTDQGVQIRDNANNYGGLLKRESSDKFVFESNRSTAGEAYIFRSINGAAAQTDRLSVSSGTATATFNFKDNKITNVRNVAFNDEHNNGNSGTSLTVDFDNGQNQKITLTGNCTLTFTAPDGPGTYKIKLIQDATGSRTVTWPAAVKWPGGAAPTLTATANAEDIVTLYYDGTNYYGQAGLNFS